jgi:hypothetical protein
MGRLVQTEAILEQLSWQGPRMPPEFLERSSFVIWIPAAYLEAPNHRLKDVPVKCDHAAQS